MPSSGEGGAQRTFMSCVIRTCVSRWLPEWPEPPEPPVCPPTTRGLGRIQPLTHPKPWQPDKTPSHEQPGCPTLESCDLWPRGNQAQKVLDCGWGVGVCQGSFVALTPAQQTPPGSQAESLCQGAFVPGPDTASLRSELQSRPWVLTAELRVSTSQNPPNVESTQGKLGDKRK